MDKALLKLAQAAVEMAKAAGAAHAIASTSKNRKVDLTVRDGKVDGSK